MGDVPLIMQGVFLGLDASRLPGPPGALDAAMRAGTTHIYVPTADDGYVRPGCGDSNTTIYHSRARPPTDAACRAAGSAGWRASCGRLDLNGSSLGPQRVFDAHGLPPTWAGEDVGWTCGSFVSSAWLDGWGIPFPGGSTAAARYNYVQTLTNRGLKILRNVETPFDALKAGRPDPLTRRPDIGRILLAWRADSSGVTAMDPLIEAFGEQLAAPTHGFWYDEEWVVGNTTRFPLTAADREVAQQFVAAGWMRSTATLNDTTVASLRPPGVGPTDYYRLRCLQTALITQMYQHVCRAKYNTCTGAVPYSAYPRRTLGKGLTGYPYCVRGPQAAGVVGKGVPQRPMTCVAHDPSGDGCIEACGEVFLETCEALGVDWVSRIVAGTWAALFQECQQ